MTTGQRVSSQKKDVRSTILADGMARAAAISGSTSATACGRGVSQASCRGSKLTRVTQESADEDTVGLSPITTILEPRAATGAQTAAMSADARALSWPSRRRAAEVRTTSYLGPVSIRRSASARAL